MALATHHPCLCFLVHFLFQTFFPQFQEGFIIINDSFSDILYKISISSPKAFLTFGTFQNLLSWYCHWCFLGNVLVLVKTSWVCKFLQQSSWHQAKCHILYSSIWLKDWLLRKNLSQSSRFLFHHVRCSVICLTPTFSWECL